MLKRRGWRRSGSGGGFGEGADQRRSGTGDRLRVRGGGGLVFGGGAVFAAFVYEALKDVAGEVAEEAVEREIPEFGNVLAERFAIDCVQGEEHGEEGMAMKR